MREFYVQLALEDDEHIHSVLGEPPRITRFLLLADPNHLDPFSLKERSHAARGGLAQRLGLTVHDPLPLRRERACIHMLLAFRTSGYPFRKRLSESVRLAGHLGDDRGLLKDYYFLAVISLRNL